MSTYQEPMLVARKAAWSGLHVTVLPTSYPTRCSPVDGIFVKEQAKALQRSGLAVTVIYPDLRSLRNIRLSAALENHFQKRWHIEDGVPTLRFHGWSLAPMLAMNRVVYRRQVLKLLQADIQRTGKPALIHAHNTLWAGAAAREAKNRYGIPYVVTEHSSAFARGLIRPADVNGIRETLQNASAVVAVSESLRTNLTEFAPGTAIQVIPNVVDTDFFRPPVNRPPCAPFRFLSVSLLSQNKRLDLLIQAFSIAFSSETDVVLEIGGSGPERNRLERLVAELRLTARVRFLGLLGREEIREALWRSHVFALTSDIETFGVVLIEAMATGLPVVATRSGGPEAIVGNEDGFLAEKGDVQSVAEALRKAFQLRAKFDASAIRARVLEKYSPQAVAGLMLNLYGQVLA